LILRRITAAYRPAAVAARAALAAMLLLLLAAGLRAQDLAAPLPLDPAIRTGVLPNGLTYFVRKNAKPEQHAIMRLAVKAGSIDEADDQRGLAHMLEHMNFNGGAHFKPGELVSYLESIGSRFGADVNAYTSYDETVYMLDVPTEKAGALDRAFDALSDFAGGAALTPEEIDRERGVVIEEWRGRQGAGQRMLQPQVEALYGDSRYTAREPIGTPEILRTFTPQRLRDFYQTYYRPDRMAVIVVGDIDPAAIEAQIREHFSAFKTPAPAARTIYPVPTHQDTRYATVSDPEAQSSSVTVIHKRPLQTLTTTADYRRLLVRSLVHQMLNARFAEIARRPDAPFLRASSGEDTIGRTVEAFTVSARVDQGQAATGLATLEQELARVRQFGFGAAELERAKLSTMASYERAYAERDKSSSEGYASELIAYFLTGEAAPGIEAELQLVRRFLPTITAAEAGEMARSLVTEDNRVVLATSPQKDGVAPITEAVLREAIRTGSAATVEPWHDDLAGRELLAKKPVPGTVASRREIPEIGVTVLTLSNGVEVWLKPTDFRNDQISFTSYSRGGTSLAPPDQFLNAALSTSLVGLAGIGGINPIDLGKLLAGKIASASPYISDYTHGVSGSATPKDLETALQLAYLDFTAPNGDRAAFELMKRRLEASLVNREQNPGSVFGDRLRSINTMDHYSARPLKGEDIGKLDPESMLSYYRARFANAADFTFFFVGAFKVDDITPLLTQYIATLPSTGKPAGHLVDMHMQFPAAVRRETVNKGREPKAQTVITFFADTGLEELEVHRLRAATDVLESKLRDILREELGGTYSVGTGYSDSSPVPGYGTTTVQFGSSPENVQKLTDAVMKELDRLRRDGPSAADVQAVKEAEKNSLATSFRQNGYWLNSLQAMHLLGRDARKIPQRVERADSLTTENIHAAFEKYFPENRYTVVTLMPEAANSSK
jgi:zinc protease